MFTASRVATIFLVHSAVYICFWGAVIVFSFSIVTQVTPFNFFSKMGVVLALFGTIIPPLLMNAGFPLTELV
jgi:hypothetical protein